jgi:hypothetical protein
MGIRNLVLKMEAGRLVCHDGKMEPGVESETGSNRPDADVRGSLKLPK